MARLQARQRNAGRERRPGEQQLEGAVLVQQQDLLAAHVRRLPARDAVAPGRVTRDDEPVARQLERGRARRQAREVRGDEEGHLERGREPPVQQPRAQPGTVGPGAALRRALGGAIPDHGIDIQVGEAELAALERDPHPRSGGVAPSHDEREGVSRPRTRERERVRQAGRHAGAR